MKRMFKVVSARPNKEKNGSDGSSIGLSITLQGIVEEEFVTRFAFGNANGASPDVLKGVTDNYHWTQGTPNFCGLKPQKTGTKLTADVTIGKIVMNNVHINNMEFSPSAKEGEYSAKFHVYKSAFKDDDLIEATHYMEDDNIDCLINFVNVALQDDMDPLEG